MCRHASEFQLVVEPYAWGKAAGGSEAPLLRLHTPTATAARLTLPAGRHVARLLTDSHTLHALDLRCSSPFQLEDLNKVCMLKICFLHCFSSSGFNSFTCLAHSPSS